MTLAGPTGIACTFPMSSTVDPARSDPARSDPTRSGKEADAATDRRANGDATTAASTPTSASTSGRRGADQRVSVPSLTWPLVERRQNRQSSPPGTERRRSELTVPRQVDQSLVPAMEPFRWAAVAVGLIVAMRSFSPHSYRLLAVTLALLAYATFRTLMPIRPGADRRVTLEIVGEMGFQIAAVIGTGAWWSPYAFSLLPTALVAGVLRGPRFAARLTAIAVLAVSARHLYAVGTDTRSMRDAAVWSSLVILVAVSSGWARQISKETARQQTLALDRLGELAEANALLFSLNRVAQTLPASLDLDEVLGSMLTRLRDLVEFETAAVLLYEDSDETWAPVRHTGSPLTDTLTTASLPTPLARAMRSGGALLVQPLTGSGLSDTAASGLYAALRARGSLIGLLAIETDRDERYRAKDVELVNGLLEPFGVAIDNARMFSRLRTMGADEERSRIARDLHDRIGQSLAHVGFELDRAVRSTDRGADPRPILEEVRGQVRSVVSEVRETLYDLRTDVSATQDVAETMSLFLDRVRTRSALAIDLEQQTTGRLPLVYERELWRIAKEAVVNVERHAQASHLRIVWRTDGRAAELTVIDDGLGFERHLARADSYGIIGMRERATSIGARFEIESREGEGTTVRVVVGGPPRPERRT